MKRHWKRWTLAGVIVALVLAVGGPFVYINFIKDEAPERLAVSSDGSAPAGAATPVAGTWTASSGSQAGYRVKEVLFGQKTEAVGRTSSITGDLTLSGTKVDKGSFTVDLTNVKSDQDRRDQQFEGRIMEVSKYPNAVFTLTQPINLGSTPTVGAKVTAKATGTLKLKTATKPVTFDVTAARTADATVEVSGTIPVKFADYGIANPSIGPIETEDNGQVEFLLKLTRP